MMILVRLIILCSLFFVLPVTVFAGEQQENRTRLEKIRQRIEKTSKSLQFQEKQELSLLRDLISITTSLQEIDRRIANLKRADRIAEKDISVVNREIKSGKKDIRFQERRLKKRLISLYKQGETGVLEILFSSTSPMELAEQYRYFSHILANDKQMMANFQAVLNQQNQRLEQLQTLQKKQRLRLVSKNNEQEDARSARVIQAQLLSKVRSDKTQLNAELLQLKEKAQRLELLIKQLKQQNNNELGSGLFASQKGLLSWPLNGAVLVGFGQQKNPELGTLYESHGIDIAINTDDKIKSIFRGKVVFSDWFKGYGNLLIVSHPGGYHTLYAQADSLYKTVGDHVEAGEVIALADASGRQSFYFEIRQSGAPVNPLEWMKSR